MTGHSELLADFDGQLCVEPGNVDWRGTGRTAANTTPSSRPFATAAEDYLAAGYSPLPCENKNLKVSGKTGKNGAPVSSEDVSNWCRQFPEANIALRLPDDLMAIDVDVAGGSGDGAVSLQELVDELGYLPATWAATARQLPYGRYFFRVPAGTLFADKVKPKSTHCSTRTAIAWCGQQCTLNAGSHDGYKLVQAKILKVCHLLRTYLNCQQRGLNASGNNLRGLCPKLRQPCKLGPLKSLK